MRIQRAGLLVLMSSLMCVPSSWAQSPSHLMVEGMLRDNTGKVLDGTFDITYSLYAAEDDETALWTESHVGQTVTAGFFQTRLGESEALTGTLFDTNPGMWLGVTLAGQPELPRTPLETDPYAFRAMVAQTANGLSCTGCIDESHLGSIGYAGADTAGGAATSALVAETANALSCTGCVTLDHLAAGALSAANVSYDDSVTALGATTVQGAIEKLKAAIGTGGTGGSGDVNEGAGSVSRYTNQWGLPSYGIATEYLHLMNPTKPKVVMQMYGGQNTGFSSSNNLIVSNTYQPNQYSGSVNGTAGDTVLTVQNAGAFNAGDHILIHQTVGSTPGHWEVSAVKSVAGAQLTLAKPLDKSYVSKSGTSGIERAQAVIAASYNQLEVVNGGVIRPTQHLSNGSTDNFAGGIIYIRAQNITVKTGGRISANGDERGGFYFGDNYSGSWAEPGESECGTYQPVQGYKKANNCSGGGGAQVIGGSCSHNNGDSGGGGNKTAGKKGKGGSSPGDGGAAKGSATLSTLEFGGGGGRCRQENGGRGGGIVVLGAKTIIIESGGKVQANGQKGNGYTGSTCNVYCGSGGGAGGTVAMFADNYQNNGTVEALGGPGGQPANSAKKGGDGGDGWVVNLPPINGIVNQSFATGVEIWVDGVNVTPSVGDPNGKGSPHYDVVNKKWGATGTEAWSTGPLDLTNVANWTLGEHKIELRETGGAGGDLKGYFYIIQPFTKSKPPVNDTCSTPVVLTPTPDALVVTGTTEDTMGKTLATDASQQGGCGGFGGPDAVYQVEVTERALLHAATIAPFSSKLYLRKATCADGELVVCADKELSTNPIDPGTYFLFVDSDSSAAKGDYTLAVSITPAPLPANDTCDTATEVFFDPSGKAVITGTTLYSLDDYKGLCPAAGTGGPDVLYEFSAGTGQTLDVTLDTEYETPIMFLTTNKCGDDGIPLSCSATGNINLQGTAGGKYWLYVDGSAEKEWGPFTLTIQLSTPGG